MEKLNRLGLCGTSRKELREQVYNINGSVKMLAEYFMMGIQQVGDNESQFKWKMNLPVICESYEKPLGYTPETRVSDWRGKMKVFAGRKSIYVISNSLEEFGNF